MDIAFQRMTKGRQRYDPEGRWAARGKVEAKWLRSMLAHSYFKKNPPKSTGREEFGEPFLNRHLGRFFRRRPWDVLATLTFFTALTIFESLKHFAPFPLKEMIVSGGGVKNLTLMNHLKKLFSGLPVRSIEEFGIPAQAKEPMAFAFFALRALEGKINHLPSVTGARRACILGKLTGGVTGSARLKPGTASNAS